MARRRQVRRVKLGARGRVTGLDEHARVTLGAVEYGDDRPRLTQFDLAFHVATAYKRALPSWGKGWMLLAELAVKVGEDLSDLYRFAMRNAPSPNDGILAQHLQMLPMEATWHSSSDQITNGWYVWVQVPKGEGPARLRERIAAARAEIVLHARGRTYKEVG